MSHKIFNQQIQSDVETPRPDTKSYVRSEEETWRFLRISVAASLPARAHEETAFVLAGGDP